MSTNTATITSPIGKIGIQCNAKQLLTVCFLADNSDTVATQLALAKKVCQQLKRYFKDPQYQFQLPLHLVGTDLQQTIWQFLNTIPSGKTMTYGEVATQLGTHPRVMGQACRANPIPIIVPCHRVIAADGGLGGYCGATRGEGLARKRYLLQHEQSLAAELLNHQLAVE